MAQNNLIESNPEHLSFFHNRKIYQLDEENSSVYEEQLQQIGNAKIIILVDKNDHRLVNPSNKTLLEKMCKAIESKGVTVGVLEIDPEKKIYWKSLKHKVSTHAFILFGLTFQDIGIHAKYFENNVLPFDQSFFLLTAYLKEFHTRAGLKNTLWKRMLQLIDKVK